MKKRIRILMPALVTLAMVVSLFGMAIPVMASQIQLAKDTDPLTPNKYYLGDTIHYVLEVGNPVGNTATNYLDVVEDILPDGSIVTLDTGVTQAPGDSDTYYYDYVVDEADLVYLGGRWRVVNQLHVEGTDSLLDIIDATTSKSSFILRPEISIEKLVDFDNDAVFTDLETYYAGADADWAIVVTNTGYDPVYGIYVSDDNMGVDFYGPFDLLANGDTEIIPVYTTNPMVDTVNTACAEGVDELGNPVGPVCDPAEVIVLNPDICIEKTVDCNDDGEFLDVDTGIVGDTGHWRIVVTNCGEADLFDVNVWDDNGESWGPFTLLAGDSVQYDYDTVVNADTTNWAYVEGFDAAGGVWLDEDDATNLVLQPDICIEKTVDCNDDGEFLDVDTGIVGDTGHWRIVVTNCGEADLYDVYVWDTNGMFWGPFTLLAGDSVQYDYDTVVNADTTNWAYVEGYDAAGGTWYDEDDATNLVINPCIDIEKTVDCNGDEIFSDEETYYAGDLATWRVVVTNCGDTPLYDVWVSDTNMGMLEIIPEFAPGDSRTYEYDTVVDVDTTNVAYVDGFDELGGYWYDEDAATNYVIDPCIDIEKTVDCNDDGVYLDEDWGYVGDTGHWRIVVTNCGDSELTNVLTSDTNGQNFGPTTLAPGANVTYEYDTVVSANTTNNATVTATDLLGGTVSAWDTATNYVIEPDICIEKLVDCNDDQVYLHEDTGSFGDTPSWYIRVWNCGDSPLLDVMVSDTNGMSWGPFDLDIGGSWNVTYVGDPIYETTTNNATAVAEDILGGVVGPVYDSATNVITGGEGCTPGYWKNNAKNWDHSAWVGYLPEDSFETVFGVNVTLNDNGKKTYPTPTLLQALDANGGGINALARHAVAALLNIANPDIGYGIGSTAALITMVHDAIVSGDEAQIEALHLLLADYNEAGCPLNQRGEPIMDGIVI